MIALEISTDGLDPYVVTAEARDVLVWERTGKGRAFTDLVSGGFKIEDLYSLAYIAGRRLGHITVTPAEFERTSNVAPHAGATEPDPTQEDL